MMFIESRFEHVHISEQIRVKTWVISGVMIGRWRGSLFSLEDWVLHLDIVLESQRFACFLLECVGVVVVGYYFTYCVSAEFVLLGRLVEVGCFWCVMLVWWDLGGILFIVYLIAEGGLAILLVLLLGKGIFILRNTLGTLWDAITWDTIVICAVLW